MSASFLRRKRTWSSPSGLPVFKKSRKTPSFRLRRGSVSRPELKFFDTALSFTIDATGEVPATGQLNLIPAGTGESQRVGRLCVVKSLQIRATATYAPGASAATAFGQGWIYVILDTQANGAAASVSDVLTGTNLCTALLNLDNSQRFRVLKKIYVNTQPQAGVSTAFNGVGQQIEVYKKLNIPLDFSSTAGAITELRSNNIFLLAGTDGNSDDSITVTGNCRLRFQDS